MGSQNGVNKKEIQSRSQEKYVRNVPGTERKLVYRERNKSWDRTKAEGNMSCVGGYA
jgi:hypothetical protein